MIGKSFSSRVGASLLSAIDMKNLITNNETDYENLILSFAKNPNKVLETKKELQFKKINSNQKQTNHEEITLFIYFISNFCFLSSENDFGYC